jgi:hypothetical protein
MRVCTIDGCGCKAIARGFCSKHWQRWSKHGDPLAGRTQAPRRAGTINSAGYRQTTRNGVIVLEHILIAERALGKRLPPGAQVHHVDRDRSNNANTNLVICPDAAYHRLLHRRQAAIDACGNAEWRKCTCCKQHDDPARMYVRGKAAYHRACFNAQRSKRTATTKRIDHV